MIDYLQAVTVCVNYSDVLKWILPNREHFDRWLVVTHKSDRATLELCRRHGIDTLCSKRLYQGRAVFHKAKALNDGLEALEPGKWTLAMDSDILLPPDFRKRIENENLYWRALYGMRGRRVCLNGNAFEVLKNRGPWTRVAHSSSILGYFQLFHLSQSRNRYPEDVSSDASSYDMAFADAFPGNLRRRLPMNCLHLGPVKENWQGRKTRKFGKERNRSGYRFIPGKDAEDFAGVIAKLKRRRLRFGHAVQVGYFYPEVTNRLCRFFEKVSLVDCWGVDRGPDELEFPGIAEASRRLYWENLEHPDRVTRAGACEADVLERFPESSVDAVYFDGEFPANTAFDIGEVLRPALNRPAFAFGWGYGIDHFPETTENVVAALGTPEVVAEDSSWARRMDAVSGKAAPPGRPVRTRRDAGFLLYCRNFEEAEAAFVSVLHLQKRNPEPCSIIYSGPLCPVLATFAKRLGIEFHEFGPLAPAQQGATSALRALKFTPYDHTVVITNGAVPRPDEIAHILEQLATSGGAVIRRPVLPDQRDSLDRLFRVAALNLPRVSRRQLIQAAHSGEMIQPDSVWAFARPGDDYGRVCFLEKVARLTQAFEGNGLFDSLPAALQMITPEATAAPETLEDTGDGESILSIGHGNQDADREHLSRILSTEVRTPPGTAVVTAVLPENLDDFRTFLPLWRFSSGNHLHVFAANLAPDDLGFLNRRGRTTVHIQELKHTYDPELAAGEALIEGIPEAVSDAHCIYINAGCWPKRGAELFLSEQWRRFGIAGCGWIDRMAPAPEISGGDQLVSPFQKLARPQILNGIGMFHTRVVRTARVIAQNGRHLPDFDRLLAMGALFENLESTAVANLANWGWEGV